MTQPTKAWQDAQDHRNLFNKEMDVVIAGDYSSVCYTSERKGKFLVKGFVGRAKKQAFYYSYPTAEARDKKVSEWMKSISEQKSSKSNNAAERELEVNDVVVASWGYEQTNVDYYLVTKLIGQKSVQLVEIGATSVVTGDMQGRCIPDPKVKKGEPFTKKVTKFCGSSVNIDSVRYARKVNCQEVEGIKVFDSNSWSSYH